MIEGAVLFLKLSFCDVYSRESSMTIVPAVTGGAAATGRGADRVRNPEVAPALPVQGREFWHRELTDNYRGNL